MSEIKMKVEHIIRWLREEVQKTGSKGLLVGLSGGVDSSVVAALIQKACPDHALGVVLPIKSSERDLTDAQKLVEKIGIQSMTLDLSLVHDLLLKQVYDQLKANELMKEEYKRMTDANLRARLRMSTLYAVANNLGYLVVGTDNAAELYTGYFTKYGDGGIDLLPLCHLLKREVYEWAKYFGIPDEIIDKPPSAGLWEGQTDEQEMGTSYQQIDNFLSGIEIPSADYEIIQRLHSRSEHKRQLPSRPPNL